MLIIDAQVHVWTAETPDRPWPPQGHAYVHRPAPLEPDELWEEMKVAGVHRAILVPPSWEGDRNDLALEAAQRHPDRFAVMGRLPLERPENESLLPDWLKQAGMLGIRLTFRRAHQMSWITDGTADWFWDAAERHDIPLMVFAPTAMGKLGEIAQRHPRLRMIIDHMGLSSALTGKPLGPAVDELLKLARFENVAVKATSLPTYVQEAFPFPSLHPLVRSVVETFGPRRVFWGSDLSHLPCTYGELVKLFTEEFDFLSDEDMEWIMGRGIAEWLGW